MMTSGEEMCLDGGAGVMKLETSFEIAMFSNLLSAKALVLKTWSQLIESLDVVTSQEVCV